MLVLAALILQDPGRMTFDTKLGVDIDPVGFYERLWHLWNPLEWFGGLQDQYIGYAFPMGAFYLIAHLLHVPVWVAERVWMSLLIVVALLGAGPAGRGPGHRIAADAAPGRGRVRAVADLHDPGRLEFRRGAAGLLAPGPCCRWPAPAQPGWRRPVRASSWRAWAASTRSPPWPPSCRPACTS